MITAGQLTQLRAVALRGLTDACSIQTYTTVSDSQGGWTDTWTTTQTAVPCLVAPGGLSPSERVMIQRLATERVYSITLPAETVITEKDQIVWKSHVLEVKSVALRTIEITVRVVAEKVA